MLKCVLLVSLTVLCTADLRQASQPKNQFKTLSRGNVKFVPSKALYMEPSTFGYAGLNKQRNNAYDNFLRSNIDNEQDRRNFNTEAGKDHLPFRTLEAAATDQGTDAKGKLDGQSMEATPGKPFIVPLRWNNPHASELEVNIWIVQNKYVVPIRKPTCSGEGHQDNVFSFTVPEDFLNLKIEGFNGCTKVGDCVLQIYSHSVESRTYSMGTPLIVKGEYAPGSAQTTIDEAGVDVGTDLSKLRTLCLPSNDPAANIPSAKPRKARYVSDVYNHAYQNSDYSPYSGQQPESISKNLQASAILKMVTGNRGELGKALLKQKDAALQKEVKALEAKAKAVIVKYEQITNKIIKTIEGGQNAQKSSAVVAGDGGAGDIANKPPQKTNNCFRCAETGSTTTARQTTNTYVPSFEIKAEKLEEAKKLVPTQYKNLIKGSTLSLYEAALEAMSAEFKKIAQKGITYQGPALKAGPKTMDDATSFKKVNAAGKRDNGVYAAEQAAKAKAKPSLLPFEKSAEVDDDLNNALERNVECPEEREEKNEPFNCYEEDVTTLPVVADAEAVPMIEKWEMDGMRGDSKICDEDQALDGDGKLGDDGKPLVACAEGGILFCYEKSDTASLTGDDIACKPETKTEITASGASTKQMSWVGALGATLALALAR